MIYLAGGVPGTHTLAPVCGDGALNLLVIKFYYCSFDVDSLISSGIAMVVTLGFVFLVALKMRSRVPGKLQMLVEFLLAYTRDQVRSTVAENAGFVVPLASTIAIFIFVADWLDFFPLKQPVFPANAILDQTVAMAIVVIVIVEAYSIRVLGVKGFLRRFTKPFELSMPMRVVFVFLNIIEEVAKPVTLSLRLFGNLFASVLMVFLLGSLFAFGVQSGGVGHIWAPLGLIFLIVWKGFGVFFVGTIQAFIFMLLTIIYFGMAREGLEEEEAHGRPAVRAAESRDDGGGTPQAVHPATPH